MNTKFKTALTISAVAGAVVGAALLAGASISPSNSPRGKLYTFHYDNVLGTSLELKVLSLSETAANEAEAAVLKEISREEKILSGWDAGSEFSRWSRTSGRPVQVSPELFDVLGLFDSWRSRTSGALDASAEGIVQVWKHAAAERRLPLQTELDGAVSAVRRKHWSLSSENSTATHLSNAPLALNSFAKIYIVNRASEAAMRTGVSGIVVNVGGDIVIRGAITEVVDVADPCADAENDTPIARVALHNLSIATSGNYRRGVEIAGNHYSHIVDPRTGMPADQTISATVVAPNPTDAGALATAFSVMKPAESVLLASTVPGVEFLLLDSKGSRTQSPGWNKLVSPLPVKAAHAAPADESPMELAIDLEIKQPSGFAKRPYVAVWIEDKDKFPVRTIALWYDRDRWLPELRAWYHDDRLRAAAEGSQIAKSVSSATRSAGKYTIKWDGKDNAGKPVKPGKYTVMLEASREHGPYQLLRGELELDSVPKQIATTGNSDIATATIEYRKADKH